MPDTVEKPGILASINTGLDWQIGHVLVVLRKTGHFSEMTGFFRKRPGTTHFHLDLFNLDIIGLSIFCEEKSESFRIFQA